MPFKYDNIEEYSNKIKEIMDDLKFEKINLPK